MRITNKSDFPVTDAACKSATGKTLKQWFKELDRIQGLKIGRRASTQHIYSHAADPWWPTTIYVEYESHHSVKKKDGRPEGYNGEFRRSMQHEPGMEVSWCEDVARV